MTVPTPFVFQVDPNWFESYWYGHRAGSIHCRIGLFAWCLGAPAGTLRTVIRNAWSRYNVAAFTARVRGTQ